MKKLSDYQVNLINAKLDRIINYQSSCRTYLSLNKEQFRHYLCFSHLCIEEEIDIIREVIKGKSK